MAKRSAKRVFPNVPEEPSVVSQRDVQASINALAQSCHRNAGGDSFDWFFLAMAYWQLGQKEEAHEWFDKAVDWMDTNAHGNDELLRYRQEAQQMISALESP